MRCLTAEASDDTEETEPREPKEAGGGGEGGSQWITSQHFPFRALKVAGEAAGHTLDEMQLICKDRDGFLTADDIAAFMHRIETVCSGSPGREARREGRGGTCPPGGGGRVQQVIRVTGFPERLPQVPF